MPEITLSEGRIHYREEGAGRPVVLIHGLGRVPGAVTALATLGRLRLVRSAAVSLAPLTVDPIPDRLLHAWMSPLRNRAIRRDLLKVVRGLAPEHTLSAVERLHEFDKPVLIAWGTRDPFFPLADAERLAALFPDARLEKIDTARAFVQMDAPERLAGLICDFGQLRETQVSAGEN